MSETATLVDLTLLQPSQLFLSAKRLEQILAWIKSEDPDELEPLPFKELDGHLMLTDGHHRAYAFHFLGYKQIKVIPDTDDLDWEAYRICVQWCLENGISSVKDLESRIVNEKNFDLLWNKRCDELHQFLKKKRCASD
jgi:hypothetical protein